MALTMKPGNVMDILMLFLDSYVRFIKLDKLELLDLQLVTAQACLGELLNQLSLMYMAELKTFNSNHLNFCKKKTMSDYFIIV